MVDDVDQPGVDPGASWSAALAAVVAALVPALVVFALWPAPRATVSVFPDRFDPVGQGDTDPLRLQILQDVYRRSQIDPDECKEDFTATVGEPSSERQPFYFC